LNLGEPLCQLGCQRSASDRQCRLTADRGQEVLILGAEGSTSLQTAIDLPDLFLAMKERSGQCRSGGLVTRNSGQADGVRGQPYRPGLAEF